MKEFKNYIEESNEFSQYEKNNELARIIMDYVLIPNKLAEERENIELFKSYLREKLKLRDKTKDDIAKKFEFGKLKKEIAKTKSVEEFNITQNNFMKTFARFRAINDFLTFLQLAIILSYIKFFIFFSE